MYEVVIVMGIGKLDWKEGIASASETWSPGVASSVPVAIEVIKPIKAVRSFQEGGRVTLRTFLNRRNPFD